MDDLEAIWFGNGCELVRRIMAYADQVEADWSVKIAEELREIIRCDRNPLPPVYPPLGDPPTLRPAVPRTGAKP